MLKAKTILLTLAAVNLLSILTYQLITNIQSQNIKTDNFLSKNLFKDDESHLVNIVKKEINLLELLGAYPDIDVSKYAYTPPRYNIPYYGLYNDDDYCTKVDAYNLANPNNMFKKKNFFTDYPKMTLPRTRAMQKVGTIFNGNIDIQMKPKVKEQRQFHLNHQITSFYTMNNMHMYMKIGKHFLCPTQTFNHIPGSGYLVRKADILEEIAIYRKKYENQPQCFDPSTYFLKSYRLFRKEECEEFFRIIHSDSYKASLETEPIQYLIKVGVGAHKSQGVFLLDDKKTGSLNNEFKFGLLCGRIQGSLIAQKYITNPLLLNMNNKFDFRIYMLIASTNPLIVYYHDGYLRVSVNTFDKSSKDRATHLTNTYLAEKVFSEAKKNNQTVNGMTAKQLKDYHLWKMEDLQKYLLESGKITDPKWLDNYLRPAFQKAFIHLVRMTGSHFLKQSNVYELHGLDFMLDADLNLWFIEDNSNPLLIGVKPDLIERMLKDLYEVQYAYYRSRMKRVLKVVNKLKQKLVKKEEVDYEALREEYQIASKNKLEPEYKISKSNTFVLILDEGQPKNKATQGHLPEECLY